MGFSTNYEGVNDYGILPEGDYETVIHEVEERATLNGAVGLNISLVVRNDLDQNYKNRYIFYTLWKRREPTQMDKQVQGYGFDQIMRLAKSAGLPSGKSYESLAEMCSELLGKTLKVTIEHREWNGKQQENVKYVNGSAYPECKHTFKEKRQVRSDAAAPPRNENFASAPMPKQPDNLSLGSLDDFEEIVSDADVPF